MTLEDLDAFVNNNMAWEGLRKFLIEYQHELAKFIQEEIIKEIKRLHPIQITVKPESPTTVTSTQINKAIELYKAGRCPHNVSFAYNCTLCDMY